MRALVFDFDGLIVDTESAIYEAWRELYLHHGHDLPLPVYVQCVGSTFGHYDPMAALEELTEILGQRLDLNGNGKPMIFAPGDSVAAT